MTTDDAAAIAAFCTEAGHLKRIQRAGWPIAGVRDPESVAEHSYRTAIIGFVLAVMEGADPNRTAALCTFHDVPEARLGDIPSIGKPFVATTPAVDVAKVQTAALPGPLAEAVQALIAEFEARETPEARCAKDADKLDCLIQAREYEAQGYRLVQPWVDTMVAAVCTESGKRLAATVLTVPVDAWWHDVVASYGMRPAAPADPDDT